MGVAPDSAVALVSAIAHEVGNQLGGIRLQAHLLDEDLDARSLAEATLAIDELAGHAGPLLALLRPLLSPGDEAPTQGPSWAEVLARVRQQVEEEGTRGTRFEISVDPEAGAAPGGEWLHPLLIALVGATLAHAGRGGAVSLDLVGAPGERTLTIEDDGEAEDLGPDAAPRGRVLAVALARELLGRAGARVEATRRATGTRIALVWPEAR